MGIDIKFDYTDHWKIKRDLDRFKRGMTDREIREEAGEAAHTVLVKYIDKAFETEGASTEAGRWPDYTDAEARWMRFRERKTGNTGPLLRWGPRGDLYLSLTDRGHRDHVFEIQGDTIRIGSRHEGIRNVIEGATLPKPFRRKGHSHRQERRNPMSFKKGQIDEARRAMFRVHRQNLNKIAKMTKIEGSE